MVYQFFKVKSIYFQNIMSGVRISLKTKLIYLYINNVKNIRII